jgi:hypothetical protein
MTYPTVKNPQKKLLSFCISLHIYFDDAGVIGFILKGDLKPARVLTEFSSISVLVTPGCERSVGSLNETVVPETTMLELTSPLL